ncbi:MAG: hypothetical protein KGQ79_03720 [Proteobacteria bacterium]|nr:hypothetical protein [Pseudomonadota bacterium]
MMIERNQIPPITLLLRRALLSRIGGYNEALPALEDWEFILRALVAGDVGALEDRLAFYHHRLKADMPVYANSVTGGVNIHSETRARLGNHIIRDALQQQPALLGVLWPILQALNAESAARATAHAELLRRLEAQDVELQAIRLATEPQRKIFAFLRRWLRKQPRDAEP